MYTVQMDRQAENITPPVPCTGWVEAEKVKDILFYLLH